MRMVIFSSPSASKSQIIQPESSAYGTQMIESSILAFKESLEPPEERGE